MRRPAPLRGAIEGLLWAVQAGNLRLGERPEEPGDGGLVKSEEKISEFRNQGADF